MPVSALLLALAAAALHALWNILLARAPDSEAATAVALLVGAAAFAPLAILTWDVDAEAVPWIVASALLELAYFGLLASAYRRSELGLVYPLSRGLAPVLVLAVATLALGADPSPAEAVGVLVIALGVFFVLGLERPRDPRGIAFGLAIAACIAAYTLVDNEGVTHAAPLPYLWLVLVGPALVYAGAVSSAKGTRTLRRAVGPSVAAAGVAMLGAYGLVLAALERAPAAPVAAVRETSVVIAAILATAILREPFRPARIAGSCLVAAGIAVLALSG